MVAVRVLNAKGRSVGEVTIHKDLYIPKKKNLRDGFFSVFSPGKAMAKLRISKFMETSCCSNTEVAPHVLAAAEIQFLHSPRAWLKTLRINKKGFCNLTSKVGVVLLNG